MGEGGGDQKCPKICGHLEIDRNTLRQEAAAKDLAEASAKAASAASGPKQMHLIFIDLLKNFGKN